MGEFHNRFIGFQEMNWLTHIASWLGKRKSTRKNPVVMFDELQVECLSPEGTTQRITWAEIRAVAVETNDQGLWIEDVYFLLFSNSKDQFCAIPQCSERSQELVARLQQLPDFNNKALIEAMGCTFNHFFLCWEKRPWVGENWPTVVEEREKLSKETEPCITAGSMRQPNA
jgi:hypothetical protein